jgi:hypothetical protein
MRKVGAPNWAKQRAWSPDLRDPLSQRSWVALSLWLIVHTTVWAQPRRTKA